MSSLITLDSKIGHRFVHHKLGECQINKVIDTHNVIVTTANIYNINGVQTNRFKLTLPSFIHYSLWNVQTIA